MNNVEKQTVNVPIEKIYNELNKTTDMMYDSMKMFDKINKRLTVALIVLTVCFTTLLTTYILCIYSVNTEYEQLLETDTTKMINRGN